MGYEMYKTGELDDLMKQFEKVVSCYIYVSGSFDKESKYEITLESGRTLKVYKNKNYYCNGEINKLFLLFMSGYSFGKCVERLGEY